MCQSNEIKHFRYKFQWFMLFLTSLKYDYAMLKISTNNKSATSEMWDITTSLCTCQLVFYCCLKFIKKPLF